MRDPNAKRWRVGETLIEGMQRAILEMRQSSQGYVICSPAYAYGRLGIPPRIPKDSTIIFDIRIVRVESDFGRNFVKLSIHQRALIGCGYILKNIREISDEAKKSKSKKSLDRFELAILMLKKEKWNIFGQFLFISILNRFFKSIFVKISIFTKISIFDKNFPF